MIKGVLVACYVADVLLQAAVPVLRRDTLIQRAMATAAGRRGRQVFHLALGVAAVAGVMTIALVPEEILLPYLVVAVMMAPPVVCLAFLFWQGRQVLTLEHTTTQRNATLELSGQPIPRVVWLAAVPPIFTAAIIAVLAANWDNFAIRFGDESSATSAWGDPVFRTIVQFMLFETAFGIWFTIQGLATWHGVARRYEFRKALIQAMVADVWGAALIVPALTVTLWLRLSLVATALWAVVGIAGVVLMIVFKRLAARARREWAAADMPPSSYSLYFDRQDPSVLSERGMNLANPWNWAIVAGPLLVAVVPLIILLR